MRFLEETGYRPVHAEDVDREDPEVDLVLVGASWIRHHRSEIEELRAEQGEVFRPVLLVVPRRANIDMSSRGIWQVVDEVVQLPVEGAVLEARIEVLMRTHRYSGKLQEINATLEDRVRDRTRKLRASRFEILSRLARAAEYRDDETGVHAQRVGRVAELIAREIGGDLEPSVLRETAPLHDVGKIGVDDAVLLKPGQLTDDEFDHIKEHTLIGADLLAGGASDLLRVAEEIAGSHHERWDGGGYPQGLTGEDIPLVGRIVALADTFDALTHERPYKGAWPMEKAVEEIRSVRGEQLDPAVVDAFLARIDEAAKIAEFTDQQSTSTRRSRHRARGDSSRGEGRETDEFDPGPEELRVLLETYSKVADSPPVPS